MPPRANLLNGISLISMFKTNFRTYKLFRTLKKNEFTYWKSFQYLVKFFAGFAKNQLHKTFELDKSSVLFYFALREDTLVLRETQLKFKLFYSKKLKTN